MEWRGVRQAGGGGLAKWLNLCYLFWYCMFGRRFLGGMLVGHFELEASAG